MNKQLVLLITYLVYSVLLGNLIWAKDYAYQGKVKGMVCAFCAYNVSKNVTKLPGVKTVTLNIDLKSGQLEFLSTLAIEEVEISKVFSDSGFSLVEFSQVMSSGLIQKQFQNEPLISMIFSSTRLEQIAPILDAIGTLAATKASQLSIKAPRASEIGLLKPILGGRQKVIKVQFIPIENNSVELKLFTEVILDETKSE